jgi:hypothetical protein
MQTWKVLIIVYCYVVRHLHNECTCNGSLNLPLFLHFFAKSLYSSLNWIAPMGLHDPPFMPHIGGAISNTASHRRSRVERSSPT